jgi:hypothetical protein
MIIATAADNGCTRFQRTARKKAESMNLWIAHHKISAGQLISIPCCLRNS